MLNKRAKYLIKDKIKRSLRIKYKYLTILQKTLFQNRNINNKKRLLSAYIINTRVYHKRVKNICLQSGEYKAVNKKLLLTRFQLNYKCITNNLQSFKINSW